ncbi:hypothetical protein MSAN_01797500 [Mycena sanguinolenta]|uniref:Uncharacterized protein n=1 Tax=Mycena sanguinolenta TaxID=230812 RepID=A0A8H7CUG5_9AGAR|nr:hypothetical protein MSAN_01797500 [Mycena sanguinolenta]
MSCSFGWRLKAAQGYPLRLRTIRRRPCNSLKVYRYPYLHNSQDLRSTGNSRDSEVAGLPDFKKMKDDVLRQCPKLKTLWVNCGRSAFLWSEKPDGTQNTAWGGPEFAADIIPRFEMFFYGRWSPPDSSANQ